MFGLKNLYKILYFNNYLINSRPIVSYRPQGNNTMTQISFDF